MLITSVDQLHDRLASTAKLSRCLQLNSGAVADPAHCPLSLGCAMSLLDEVECSTPDLLGGSVQLRDSVLVTQIISHQCVLQHPLDVRLVVRHETSVRTAPR